jgi:hypothetical protein
MEKRRTLKTRQRVADTFIDDIIQCAEITKSGTKKVDKHYLQVVEDIRKDITRQLR